GHHGSVGDRQDQVGAVGSGAVPALAGGPVARPAVRAALVVQQGGGVAVDLQDHVTAPAAVAAVGSAQRLELLTVDGGTAVPAVSGLDVQDRLVDEIGHGAGSSVRLDGRTHVRRASGTGPPHVTADASSSRAYSLAAGVGTMLTALRPRRFPNLTVPATSANRVSSPPRPTLSPGWKRVPR